MANKEETVDLYKVVDPYVQLCNANTAAEVAFYGHSGRLVHKFHHYLPVYERHFAAFRRRPVRVLELGVQNGGSLQMWRRYFGPDAVLHGLDIDERCRQINDPGITIHIGSQSDTALLDAIVTQMGGVDIVIDDASHVCANQIASFEHLWPRMADGGVYLCEDVHTSYWPAYGGGLKAAGSFVEYAKEKVDELHAWYIPKADLAGDRRGFARQATSVLFYDGIVVFEKWVQGPPFATVMGQEAIFSDLADEMTRLKAPHSK